MPALAAGSTRMAESDTVYPLLRNMALAMVYISSSELSRLNELIAHSTKRQLSFVYPLLGCILSKLGEKFLFLYPRLSTGEAKCSPVSSQQPVQRLMAQSASNSNFIPRDLAKFLRPFRSGAHG